MGVSAIRRVRGRGGHRASRSGRRASNASKSQTKTARSRSIWDDVPLGERVEGSPSRRPVRVRDAVQVALYAGQERRGVRGVAHRARPPARDPNLPAGRTFPFGRRARRDGRITRTVASASRRRFRETRRKGRNETRRGVGGAPPLSPKSRRARGRADGSRRVRSGRESDREGNGLRRRCRGRTFRGGCSARSPTR